MEATRSAGLCPENFTRLPYTVRDQTSIGSATQTKCMHATFLGHVRSHKHHEATRGVTSGATIAQLYLPNFPSCKKRRHMETYIQSEKSQQVCKHRQVQVNKRPTGNRFSPTKRLDGQNRHPPSLFPRPCCHKSQAIFEGTCRRPQPTAVRDDLLALRAQFSSQDFRHNNQLGSAVSSQSGDPSAGVPGRFLFSPSGQRSSQRTRHPDCEYAEIPGLASKYGKICSCAPESPRIFRHNVELLAKHQIHPVPPSSEDTFPRVCTNHKKEDYLKRTSKPHRCVKLCEFCRDQRQTEFPILTNSSQQCIENEYSKNISIAHGGSSRTRMVANKLYEAFGNSCTPAHTLSHNRCERHWLGCQIEQRIPFRVLATLREEPPLQHERNDCHPKRNQRSRSAPELRNVTDSMRQPNRRLLFTERGGGEISEAHTASDGDFSNTRSIQHTYVNLSHSRELQLRRRSPVAAQGTPRVASTATYDQHSVREVGCSGHRFVCLETSPCRAQVLYDRQERQTGKCIRCAESRLGLQAGMGIPTTFSDPQGTNTPQQSERNLPASSPSVAESLLEAGRKESVSFRSIHGKESRPDPDRRIDGSSPTQGDRNDPGGMEMWGWSEHLRNWTEEQKSLLLSSWRSSTLKTYRPAWYRWLAWAKKHNINVFRPTGSDLARFLSDLHQKEGLSLSTILVHKSVVSTFCNPNSGTRLSSHILVKQVLKSIALLKPRTNKAPVWDIDILVQYLTSKDPQTNSIYEASQITAAILLLCSGRRVHDLTLLSITPAHCVISEDYIILWPRFGSKTDTANHRQSGWRLSVNKENKTLDPTHWLRHLIMISKTRREAAKCDNLFLSTTGSPRPATRTIIAGWLKNLFREANIEATPGSFRSAVASKNWTENFPLDEILSRGNWRSADTFKNFYCREIRHTNNNNSLITNLFTPMQ